MNKVKKGLIASLAVCATACFGLALTACEYPEFKVNDNSGTVKFDVTNGMDEYPEYINTTNPDGEGEFNGTYNLNITSAGGLVLNDVMVSFKKDGEVVAQGVSRNGRIDVDLEADVYTIEVDASTLPLGYYIPDNANFQTSATSSTVNIKIPSKVISSTAPSSTRYSVGDIMYDFSLTAEDDNKYLLSELLETKKTVFLNFWYIECGPCIAEFPSMHKAYNMFLDDAMMIAVTTRDSMTAMKNFQEQYNYSFRMAQDSAGLLNFFSITATPTTVIVDRYGVIAEIFSGSTPSTNAWTSKFARYTSNNYTQDIITDNNPGGEEETVIPPPEGLEMTSSDIIKETINDEVSAGKISNYYTETSEKDGPNNWPWVIEEGTDYLQPSNYGKDKDPSFSIFYMDLDLKAGDIVSFEYEMNVAAGYDNMYIILDSRTLLGEYAGDSEGWQKEEIFIATRDTKANISFTYMKNSNGAKPEIEDFIHIRNIRIQNVENVENTTDIARSAEYLNLTLDMIKLWDDGYYHIDTGRPNYTHEGAILFVDISHASAWSDKYAGGPTFKTPEGSTAESAMRYFSFYFMSNRANESEETLKYNYLSQEDTDYLNHLIDMQNFSSNGYLPVTERLRKILEKFCEEFRLTPHHTGEYSPSEWLEMCYVYQHFMADHDNCLKTTDPVKGMMLFNATEAHLGKNEVNITSSSVYNGGGTYMKFKVPESGVYKLYSKSYSIEIDPIVFILETDGDDNPIGYREYMLDLSYDLFVNSNLNDFLAYEYYEKGEVINFQLRQRMPGATGRYEFFIEKLEVDEYDWLKVCTTGEGLFTGFVDTYYLAVDWTYNSSDDCHYNLVTNDDGTTELGSKIYIDFIHPNFYDQNNHSLYEMVQMGYFNLSEDALPNYTTEMLQYYYKSLEGKKPSDELYGMIEANQDLVNMIADVFSVRGIDSDGYETGYWLSVACYYAHIGAK